MSLLENSKVSDKMYDSAIKHLSNRIESEKIESDSSDTKSPLQREDISIEDVYGITEAEFIAMRNAGFISPNTHHLRKNVEVRYERSTGSIWSVDNVLLPVGEYTQKNHNDDNWSPGGSGRVAFIPRIISKLLVAEKLANATTTPEQEYKRAHDDHIDFMRNLLKDLRNHKDAGRLSVNTFLCTYPWAVNAVIKHSTPVTEGGDS